jgi:hypothetical protein
MPDRLFFGVSLATLKTGSLRLYVLLRCPGHRRNHAVFDPGSKMDSLGRLTVSDGQIAD